MPSADPRPTWPQFVIWAAGGAALGLVFAGAFVLPLAAVGLVVAVLLLVLAARISGGNASTIGLLLGFGAWAIVIGILNHDGPGSVCHAVPNGQTCTDEWSPWPFWLAGIGLMTVPTAMFALARRRSGTAAA